jgi:hypothetical protein
VLVVLDMKRETFYSHGRVQIFDDSKDLGAAVKLFPRDHEVLVSSG